MSTRAMDVLGGLGDAIAGVDRDAAYRTGMKQRADIDATEAQAEAAMALAMERRRNAEMVELEKAARERFAAAAARPDWDPGATNIGDVVLGGMGSDYSGAMQGRNYGQQYGQRELVATPEGDMLGDQIVTDPMRQAALDALAPSAAVTMRRPRAPGAPVVVEDPDNPGQPLYVAPEDAVGRRPAARPSATSGQATTQERNIEALMARGVDEQTAIEIVYNERPNPQAAYTAILNSTRLRYASDEEAEAAARATVEALYGVGALERANQPLIDREPEPAPTELAGDDDYVEGEELENPETGQRIVLRGGVWYDVETGQPVQ